MWQQTENKSTILCFETTHPAWSPIDSQQHPQGQLVWVDQSGGWVADTGASLGSAGMAGPIRGLGGGHGVSWYGWTNQRARWQLQPAPEPEVPHQKCDRFKMETVWDWVNSTGSACTFVRTQACVRACLCVVSVCVCERVVSV